MTRRRSRNEGSIYFIREKGLWAAQLTMQDGSRRVKYSKKQGAVKEWLLASRNALRNGLLPNNEQTTVSQFLGVYLDTVGKQTLRPRTQEIKESLVRVHLNPALGSIKLKDLRPDHLQSFYAQELQSGLSKRTVQLLHVTLR